MRSLLVLILILCVGGCLANTKTMKPDEICGYDSPYELYMDKYEYSKLQMIDGKKVAVFHVPAAGGERARKYAVDFYESAYTYCECKEGQFSYKDNQTATTVGNLITIANSKELKSLASTTFGAELLSEAIYWDSIKKYRAEFICQRAGKIIFKGDSFCKLEGKGLNGKTMVDINYLIHD